MNARFWAFINNDWVKITVQPEHDLSWHKFSRDDEGYGLEACDWRIESERGLLFEEYHTECRDCDGRTEDTRYFQTRICDLYKRDDGDPKVPEWEKIHESRRDYAAEAMNY